MRSSRLRKNERRELELTQAQLSLRLLTTVTLKEECFNISVNTKEENTSETNAAWPQLTVLTVNWVLG